MDKKKTPRSPKQPASERIEDATPLVGEADPDEVTIFAKAPAPAPPSMNGSPRPSAFLEKKAAERTAPPEQRAQGVSRIRFETFLRVSGLKPDQRAGFKAWAKANKEDLVRLPAVDWKLLLSSFQNTPIRGAKSRTNRR